MAALEAEDPRSIGDYQLLERLGAGGMGRVYLGRSPGGRQVAVKLVHAELVRRPEFRDRFRREVEAAQRVSGAFTAPVIDADPDAPAPWLVTSYIAGPSLREAVVERGAMPPAEVRSLAAGLAEALVSIHRANLVHRDLKPSNVLLADDGPRVIDFGIARVVEGSSITSTGLVVGSPGFMSPEQINSGEITAASDVFSLGAVLAFAATGGNPFGDGPTPALLYRVVHNDPDLGAVADPELRALIADCLVKEPERRPSPREILARVGANGVAATRGTGIDPRVVHHQQQGAVGFGGVEAGAFPGAGAVPGGAAGPGFGPAGSPFPPASPASPSFPSSAFPEPSSPSSPSSGTGARSGSERSRGRVLALSAAAVAVVAALGVGAGLYFTGGGATPSAEASAPAAAPAAAGVKPVGDWPLDEQSGTTAADTTGANNGTASAVAWGAGPGGAAEFNGTSSQVVTQGPGPDTGAGRSFTVSAWVYLKARKPDAFATAVSQDSGAISGFFLQYSGADHRWAFSSSGVRALSLAAPAANRWTHLVGVYDATSRQLRLFVDGRHQSTAIAPQPVVATGPLVIGRATFQGRPTDFFPGAIRNVQAFDRTLTPAQIRSLGGGNRPHA